ncbi:hypothetical protein SDC9_134781 [bioreactor metagenome]|uniref:Uncharacterized protein n=1 Tax=bioreactor metagenome TaxID=1076179 RepID=A0A645DEJ8_9ZZZZ
MQALRCNRSPVDDYAGNSVILPDHNVFKAHKVKDFSSCRCCSCDQFSYGFHGICHVIPGLVFLIPDPEVVQDMAGFFLHDNAREHHASSPHAASERQLLLVNCNLCPGFGKILCSHKVRRSPSYKCHIDIRVIEEGFRILIKNCPCDYDFVEFHFDLS